MEAIKTNKQKKTLKTFKVIKKILLNTKVWHFKSSNTSVSSCSNTRLRPKKKEFSFPKTAICNIFTVICLYCICMGKNYTNPLLSLFCWILTAVKVIHICLSYRYTFPAWMAVKFFIILAYILQIKNMLFLF